MWFLDVFGGCYGFLLDQEYSVSHLITYRTQNRLGGMLHDSSLATFMETSVYSLQPVLLV